MKFGHKATMGRVVSVDPLISYVPELATNGMKIERICSSVMVSRLASSAMSGLASLPLTYMML